MKLLLFDLDGTLLDNEKQISRRTLEAIKACREQSVLIGVCTSRSEQNCLPFLSELQPDILISSGGALVKSGDTHIHKAEFSGEEVRSMISTAREICGSDCEITIDTLTEHYWNYKVDPRKQDKSWGDTVYSDFTDFDQAALKVCVEIFDDACAEKLKAALPDCDCIRFMDGFWYKFTKNGVTKEGAIERVCEAYNISLADIAAFGDDLADIGMLKLCGTGVAMGNALDEVKENADIVIGRNDEDGIAEYLEKEMFLSNIDKVHTTEMGACRIAKNLKLECDNVVTLCKSKVMDKNCNIYRKGKNWYCETDNIRITINSYSYTIITAHLIK